MTEYKYKTLAPELFIEVSLEIKRIFAGHQN